MDFNTSFEKLREGNKRYVESNRNPAIIDSYIRKKTYKEGQNPFAIIISCSDSRVPVEHVFSAGIGDVFVIRSAGNVLREIGIGSVEYGADHLNVPLILVLGHRGCGAVSAALGGDTHGNITDIVDEIKIGIGSEKDAAICEQLNVENVMKKIESGEIISSLIQQNKTKVIGGIYDTETGRVDFMEFDEKIETEIDETA